MLVSYLDRGSEVSTIVIYKLVRVYFPPFQKNFILRFCPTFLMQKYRFIFNGQVIKVCQTIKQDQALFYKFFRSNARRKGESADKK